MPTFQIYFQDGAVTVTDADTEAAAIAAAVAQRTEARGPGRAIPVLAGPYTEGSRTNLKAERDELVRRGEETKAIDDIIHPAVIPLG